METKPGLPNARPTGEQHSNFGPTAASEQPDQTALAAELAAMGLDLSELLAELAGRGIVLGGSLDNPEQRPKTTK
jgi:hypothetical protein